MKYMRQPTLQTLGFNSVLEIFQKGKLPVTTNDLVDSIFGSGKRGALVISGANGIVGAGKAMQLGARLEPFGVTIVGLDFPGAADGIGKHYTGLEQAFGTEGANRVMSNLVRLAYDGKRLPSALKEFQPRFLLEAIPELLQIKRTHYELFRSEYPGIEIRSVTSGFPSSELGVGVAHPSFPHEINKIWETVEPKPSDITRLFWSLGLVPVPTSDNWSFILDVLFCGATLAALRYHRASNMPYWKVDKYARKLLGPNPFRAHDAIGAKGANFLTWSCLYHLAEHYGELFRPTPELEERKSSGQDWYPLNHFRPIVNWTMTAADKEEFADWIYGPLFQMTSLLLHEKRGHLAHINAMGELCAQFRRGILAVMRETGADGVIRRVEAYHRLHPAAAKSCWHPDTFSILDTPEAQQLYVNAEHDSDVGVIAISRESYNHDVDAELNRALNWLKAEGIRRVIVTGDFHLATQMVGADTNDFFPALDASEHGYNISERWSKTARRLHDEFDISVGFINGKRCLGGFLELMMHCHFLIALDDAQVGMPEVTLPVVPGMEGCHWAIRKNGPKQWPKILNLLLTGSIIPARDTVGWLVDYAAPLDEALQVAWRIASDQKHNVPLRKVERESIQHLTLEGALNGAKGNIASVAVQAVWNTIRDSCAVKIDEALAIQARHSADFMISKPCKSGRIGQEYSKIMNV